MNAPDPNAKPTGFAKWMGWIALLALMGLAAVILVPKLVNKDSASVNAEPVQAQPEEPARKKPTFDTR